MNSKLDRLVFVGFNSRVAALDRANGDIVWSWKAPRGYGFVAILLDQGTLFASVNGYTYALDPCSGEQLWQNEMSGFGFGVPCLATAGGHSAHPPLGEADDGDDDSSTTSVGAPYGA